MQFRLTPIIASVLVIIAVATDHHSGSHRAGSDTALSVRLSAIDEYWNDPHSAYTCGHISCSYYMNRHDVQSVATAVGRYQNATTAAIGLGFAAACGANGVGGFIVTLCAGTGATAGGLAIDQFTAAAQRGQCIRMFYYSVPDPLTLEPAVAAPPSLDLDNSGYCKDG